MKATNLLIRISPFLLALLLGTLGPTGTLVSSQPQGQGGLVVRSRVRGGKEGSQS